MEELKLTEEKILERKETEKSAIISSIRDRMSAHGIKIQDLPEFQSVKSEINKRLDDLRYDYEQLRTAGHQLYDMICDQVGEEKAYKWVESNLGIVPLTEFDIRTPHRYKMVNVMLELELAVPNNWGEADIEDYATNMDHRLGSMQIHTIQEDIDLGTLEQDWDYCNNTDEFYDSDFEE